MKQKTTSLRDCFSQVERGTLMLVLVVCGIFGPSIFIPVHGVGWSEPNSEAEPELDEGARLRNGQGERRYIVVVMTAGASQTSLAKLGAALEQTVMYGE